EPRRAVGRGLRDAGAHAAPEDTRPLLEALVTQYGPHIEIRTEAMLLRADTSPARAIEILEPLVTKARQSQTMPPPEFMVKAWVTACDGTGRSPVKELVDLATNLLMDETARIKAVKELGHRPDPLGEKALETILVESTGDGCIRRMAAQGIRDTIPHETACEIFRRTAAREADLSFAQFLADMIEKNCQP